jgi:hypothetical protein
MEMEAPTVQVVTNAAPHREIIDALQELRVIVLQAIDKLVSYLGDDQLVAGDRIKLIDAADA